MEPESVVALHKAAEDRAREETQTWLARVKACFDMTPLSPSQAAAMRAFLEAKATRDKLFGIPYGMNVEYFEMRLRLDCLTEQDYRCLPAYYAAMQETLRRKKREQAQRAFHDASKALKKAMEADGSAHEQEVPLT